MFRRLPFGYVDGIVPCVRDSNDEATVLEAITQRVAVKLPDIDGAVLQEFAEFVKGFLAQHLRPLKLADILSFDEWIEEVSYPEERKTELRNVWEELHGHLPTRKQSSTVKCFIKTESYPIGDVIKPARGIMSRSDWAKVHMGPAMRSIEKEVYEMKQDDGNPFFIKHVPVNQRHLYVDSLRSAGCRYLVTDYTAFESSFASPLMKVCECELYRYMLSANPKLAAWINNTLTGDNKLRFPGGTRATVRGRRMSGDMCTSLGNGFTNLMLMLFFSQRNGLRCRGFVEGDDGVFAVQGDIPPNFAEQFGLLGFVIKMAEFSSPGLGGFCGIISADSGNVRDPVRFLSTFGWTHSCLEAGDDVMHSLLRAKAMSAAYESPQSPVVRPLADRILELTAGYTARFVDDGYHELPPAGTAVPRYNPSQATRDLFAELFGVPVTAQLEMERKIARSTDFSFIRQYLLIHPNHDFVRSRFVGP